MLRSRIQSNKYSRVVTVVLMMLLFVCLVGCGETPAGAQSSSSQAAQQPVDGALDPENTEQTEHGAQVSVPQLVPESQRSLGIDVSKWQGRIDWIAVKDSGVEFAFVRIGYRGEDGIIYRDDCADYNIQQAQKAGVLVGVYFFSTAINTTEAEEEAAWVLDAIEGYAISYPVVYDCEGYLEPDSRMYRVTPEQRTDAALAFLAAIEQAGYDTMFYAARNELLSENCWQTKRIEPAYKIWVAQYPAVTYPTQKQPDYSGRCDAWQYTNQGVVDGIDGGTDLVVCYFKKEPAKPKNAAAAPPEASAPPTQEDRLYTAVEETVTAKERVNLRSAATTKSGIVAQLYNGQTLIRTGVGSNGWSRLEYNGQTVYAITSYLTTDTEYTPAPTPDVVHGNTFTAKSDEVTAKERVNLRALPTTDSEIVGELHSGEFLQRTAVSDKGWSRLLYNGQTVYAVTSYLSNEVVQIIPDNDIVHGNTFTAQNDQVTAKEYVNLRALPTTDSEAVGTLAAGQYLQRTAVSDKGWSRLIYNGQTVYAVTSYLTN